MLPGFRFLFAAVVLSVSTLVFGLGAAALLRASHEQFASLPQLMPAPALPVSSVVAAAPPQGAAPPTLAMLRIENPVAEPATGVGDGNVTTATTPERIPAPPPTEPPPAATLPLLAPQIPQQAAQESSPAVVAAPEPVQPTVTASPEVAAVIAATPAAAPAANSPAEVGIEPEAAKTAEPLVATVAEAPAMAMEAPAPSSPPAPAPAAEPAVAAATPVAIASAAAAALPNPVPPGESAETTVATEPAAETPPPSAAASEAPIQTAMLNQDDSAMAAVTPLAPVAIEGPIPLPRSRAWALARSQPPKPAAKQRKLVTRTVRPQAAHPAVAAPAPRQAPSGLFPFGE